MRLTLMYAVVVLACAATPALASGPPAPTSPEGVVTAFYYPWFATITEDGDYAHWAQYGHLPPNDISSVYYPALGVYSSDDPSVLDAQMGEIERAGIGQIAVSWWGKGSPKDQRLPAVATAARAHGIDVAVHMEPYRGRTVASVLDDVAYLAPLGIRTFFVYQAFTLPPASWADANDTLHAEGYITYADTALVGQAVTGHFTGVYTYDSMWHAAIRSGADAVTITSFNEWQEGTQIEPAAPPDRRGRYSYASYNGYSYASYDGAWGLTGRAAESAYLDRTAFWISRFLPIQEAESYPVST